MQALSISTSDYWRFAMEYIHRMLERGDSCFTTLSELGLLIQGHETAFQQLGVRSGFTVPFSEWIYATTGESGCAGWVYAIEQLALKRQDQPVNVFRQLLSQFEESRTNHPKM